MSASSLLSSFVEITFFVCLIYMLALCTFVIVLLVYSTVESRYRRRQQEVEDYDGFRKSRYTIPVSIVASAYNEEVMILASVASLLRQNYPEFELILVDDGSTDTTLSLLQREYDLQPGEYFYRDIVPCKPIRAIFRSRRDPRLIVVHKENGGRRADAMNCGLNFARYPYFCSVDTDTIYMPDALLKSMSLVAKNPSEVVGVTSLFGVSLEPEAEGHAENGRLDRHLLSNFQHIDLMRSFVANRLAWSRLGSMLCTSGAFAIWRWDVIIELGGYDNRFSCEDIELTFRIHEKFRRERRPYQILSLPEMVARTEAPHRTSELVRQRSRWQKGMLETVWQYRYLFFRPRYGAVGMIGVPYYVFFEAFAPLMQALSFASLGFAVWVQLYDWPLYLVMMEIVIFAGAIPTTVAISLHDAAYRDYSLRDIVRMLLLGPLDLFLYRPIIIYAGLRGTWQFLRGDRAWDKFERNVRLASGRKAALPG
ncbi:MAG: glycosyltransferase [Burkholderiales bacterium]|nr:glycosyltransferase family 2 protein [Burkholderiales bacterium]MDQ3197386.1 glycosyltransferase [Pseudomonadota bacterium]